MSYTPVVTSIELNVAELIRDAHRNRQNEILRQVAQTGFNRHAAVARLCLVVNQKAGLQTQLNSKTLGNIHVSQQRNVNVVELESAVIVNLAALLRIKQTSRQAQKVCSLILEFSAHNKTYTWVAVISICHHTNVHTNHRANTKSSNFTLCLCCCKSKNQTCNN